MSTPSPTGPPVVVVAAVVRGADGRVLLTRRPEGSHMGGLWEFPGGKVEHGESPAAALERELAEELGVRARVGRPFTFAVHDEPGLRILLLFYETVLVDGTPRPLEGQELAWVAPHELVEYPMPPADDGLVELLARSTAP
ncbi:MAG TPA: (deoxy)nucleoside triphosphate pyrophosphohydrolase [Candidatus Sulfomarinibacteraceae bacterium]|nr:(deoxy)nucleoside triphosphate pyrophosphohydrolase [Candidatus Sulfomarinibacteraceae bacterium]